MYDSLRGKRILVVGAAGGIGRASALLLQKAGAVVMGSDLRDKPDLQGMTCVPCDVTDLPELDNLFAQAAQKLGGLDGFVYSAGLGSSAGFLDTTPEHFDRIMAVNLRGAFYAARQAVRLMEHGGSVVFVASQKGLCGSTGSLAYNASKGGMVIMARSMALELGALGIRVNCVCPGPTDTDMFREDMAHQPDPQAAWRKVAAANPLYQITKPEKIAAGVAYMLSEEASFVTGTELVIDGGNIAGVRNI